MVARRKATCVRDSCSGARHQGSGALRGAQLGTMSFRPLGTQLATSSAGLVYNGSQQDTRGAPARAVSLAGSLFRTASRIQRYCNPLPQTGCC